MMALVAIVLGTACACIASRRAACVEMRSAAAALIALGVAANGQRLGVVAGVIEAIWVAATTAIAVTVIAAMSARR